MRAVRLPVGCAGHPPPTTDRAPPRRHRRAVPAHDRPRDSDRRRAACPSRGRAESYRGGAGACRTHHDPRRHHAGEQEADTHLGRDSGRGRGYGRDAVAARRCRCRRVNVLLYHEEKMSRNARRPRCGAVARHSRSAHLHAGVVGFAACRHCDDSSSNRQALSRAAAASKAARLGDQCHVLLPATLSATLSAAQTAAPDDLAGAGSPPPPGPGRCADGARARRRPSGRRHARGRRRRRRVAVATLSRCATTSLPRADACRHRDRDGGGARSPPARPTSGSA